MINLEKYLCEDLNELGVLAPKLNKKLSGYKIIVFKGQLGAGKTTLVQELAKINRVSDRVSSPTFSIVNEYRNADGEIFYHFDFYRIEKEEEAVEIGVDEYFYSGNVCWIEWAERIPSFIPPDFALIHLEVLENGTRVITLQIVKDGKAIG